ETLPRIEQRLNFMSRPIKSLQGALEHVQGLAAGGAGAQQGAAQGTPLPQTVLAQVWTVAAGAFTTLVALFFILVSGETFLRRLVEILPRFKSKRQVVDISQEIEDDLSKYLGTITMMNAAVGIATGTVAGLCGLGDPLLWGILAFLLNYVPILGPTAGVITFFIAGLVTLDPLWAGLCPGRALHPDPCRRGRDDHAAAAGPPVYREPGAGHDRGVLLVLDVGRRRGDPRHPAAGDHEDHLRPDRAAAAGRPFHRPLGHALNEKAAPD